MSPSVGQAAKFRQNGLMATADDVETTERPAGPGRVRPIVTIGDPVLAAPCREVTEFGDDLKQLVDDMFATMYAAPGVGLAANQIGRRPGGLRHRLPRLRGGQPGRARRQSAARTARAKTANSSWTTRAACRSPARSPTSLASSRSLSPASTGQGLPCGSKPMDVLPAACSTRPITSAASSTSTGFLPSSAAASFGSTRVCGLTLNPARTSCGRSPVRWRPAEGSGQGARRARAASS